jgi:hypothetical protein
MAVIENIKIEGDASKLIDAIDQLNKRVGELEGQLKDVNTGVKDLGKTGNSVSKAVGGIGTALKGIGIGVFIAAFDQLKEVFTGNQKVMDIFNTLLNTLKILFNDLAEAVLPPVSNLLNSIFSDPVQSIKDFGQAIQDYVLNFFDQILSSVGHLGSALVSLFKGDFSEALEQVKLAGADAVDALVGVEEGGIEAVKNVAKTAFEYAKNLPNQIKEAVNSAQALVELEKAAQLAAVQRQKIQLEYQRSAEVLRQLRDDETKSIDERIKANADLLALLEEQTAKEREQIEIQVAFARAEYEKNKTTENLVALRQAELELIDLTERLEGQRSEALTNQNSLMREQLDIQRSATEAANEAFETQAQASLDAEIARRTADAELILNEEEKARTLYEIERDRINKQEALNEQLNANRLLLVEEELARLEAQGQTETAYYQDLANQKLQIDADYNANKEALDSERVANEKANDLRIVENRRALQEASYQIASQSLEAISALQQAFAKEAADGDEATKRRQFEIQKKLSLASAIVSGIESVQNAFKSAAASPITSLLPAYPAIQATLAGAFAAAQVAAIGRSQFESTQISTSAASTATAPSVSPSFNVVGQSGINQLAESIGQQNRQPMRAYVVGSDVTSSQELERKRIKTATFG